MGVTKRTVPVIWVWAMITALAWIRPIFSSTSGFTPETPEVMIMYSGDAIFDDVIKGLRDELEHDFILHRFLVNRKTTRDQVSTMMSRVDPLVVLLIDNLPINLYKEYQQGLPPGAKIIPSISLMAVEVETAVSGLKNALTISYEVPIVTSLINLRSILGKPIRKVGIIHREFMTPFIERNRRYCAREGFDFKTVTLPNVGIDFDKRIADALRHILDDVDVFWLPNDNVLLRRDIIQRVWIPLFRRHKVPLIVGLELLVQPHLDFGTFAVIPDHVALGQQAAGLVFHLAEDDHYLEHLSGHHFPPLSIIKILNYRQAGHRFDIEEKHLQQVDRVIQ